MTEKRFTYDSKTVSILKDGEFWLDGNVDTACNHSEICNELNKLAEENEQLKQTVSDWSGSYDELFEDVKRLEEKNEQLRTKNNAYIQDIEVFKEENTHLKLENEQLKKENNKLHQKIFEMRTNVALDRTEISRQSYTPKEFLDEIEKW